jgi:hypothetical protein
MGVSGGSKSKTGSAQGWAKPIATSAAGDTTGVYNAAQPGLQNITGQVQGEIPGILDKYHQGNPVLNAASGYDVNLLGRDPYAGSAQLDNLVNTTGGHVADQVGARFGSRGDFGGTQWTTALSKGLADNEAGLRYQDAQNIMSMQQAASQGAPQKAAADYLGIQPFLQSAQLGAQLPYTGISAQADALSALFNGGTQKTSQGIGGILQGVGSIGSAIGSIKGA